MKCLICHKELPDTEKELFVLQCELYYELDKSGNHFLSKAICPECHYKRTIPNYDTKKEN